jgi:hypothetical protein
VFNIRLSYECCQSSARHKNAGQGGKRDKPSMDKFDCHGLLLFKFAIRDDGVWVHFSINHAIKHAAYLDIEVPSAVLDFIKENEQLSFKDVSYYSISSFRHVGFTVFNSALAPGRAEVEIPFLLSKGREVPLGHAEEVLLAS